MSLNNVAANTKEADASCATSNEKAEKIWLDQNHDWCNLQLKHAYLHVLLECVRILNATPKICSAPILTIALFFYASARQPSNNGQADGREKERRRMKDSNREKTVDVYNNTNNYESHFCLFFCFFFFFFILIILFAFLFFFLTTSNVLISVSVYSLIVAASSGTHKKKHSFCFPLPATFRVKCMYIYLKVVYEFIWSVPCGTSFI